MGLPDWMTSTGFMVAMGVVLLALIGLLLFLRNQRPD
jgi:LPXTG-motif cell wall-anchored protein